MRNKSKLRKREAGQTLVIVTVILALSALVIAPMLRFTYTGHQSVRIREERMLELYAADAGIEDAMYQLMMEDEFEGLGALGYGEGDVYYTGTPDSWNDRNMSVEIEKVWIPESVGLPAPDETTNKSDKLKMVGLYTFVEWAAAEDDFEATGWGGGTGWPDDWDVSGSAIKGSDGGYSGERYLKFEGSDGSAQRKTSLLEFYEPRLQFYANAGSFEATDYVECLVSNATDPTSEDWETLLIWEDGNDTDEYVPFNVDISSWGNSSDFWVAFDAHLASDIDTVAWDDFENGWSGGDGWNGAWSHSGYSALTSSNGPHSGNYHLQLRSSSGDVNREVLNLSNYNEQHLQFYIKRTNNWESSDRMRLRVSSNELSWTTIKTWYRGDVGTSYQFEDVELSPYVTETTTWFKIRFDAGMDSSYEHFYVDDIDIIGEIGGHFYVDDLWLGDDVDAYTIEIAYTDIGLGPAFLETLGAWLPPGWEYQDVIEVDGLPDRGPDVIESSFAGGTVIQWNFSPREDLYEYGIPPVVRSLTFTFTGGQDNEGIFAWMKANSDINGTGNEYLSWDTGYEIYRAVSSASHEIWGSNTRVVAYTAQGETEKRGLIAYGNYRATGAPLLIDANQDSAEIKEKIIDPEDTGTWYCSTGQPWYDCDGILYSGRAEIDEIPDDPVDETEVKAAWLYWSAFLNYEDWDDAGSEADTTVDFMYPKVYGPETFPVQHNEEESHLVYAGEPIVQEPRDVLAYLTPKRYYNEFLGVAYDDNGNETFTTNIKPVLTSPQPEVFVDGYPKFEGEHYTMDYATGEVTIIDEDLAGNVYIDYSVSALGELEKGEDKDYTVNYETGEITIVNDYLVGNVTVYYWAQHWERGVTHNAEDRYGTQLPPVEVEVLNDSPPHAGWTYACFSDVTDNLLGGEKYVPLIQDYAVPTGNGEYAVNGVESTQGVGSGGSEWREKCFSGWSLIILYESATETAHQFYLFDPIHNTAQDFQVMPDHELSFTFGPFYPPEGTVDGRLTYFVGEGDEHYSMEYIQFRAHSEDSFPTPTEDNCLGDPFYNPWYEPMNAISTTGERGVDIDTFDILESVGDTTEGDLRLKTNGDRWYLVYVILSFKTSMVPKQDYFFNVAAVTYSYELGTIE